VKLYCLPGKSWHIGTSEGVPNEVEVKGNIPESESICSIVSEVYFSPWGSQEDMAGSEDRLLT
jgi:hypothetical protein